MAKKRPCRYCGKKVTGPSRKCHCGAPGCIKKFKEDRKKQVKATERKRRLALKAENLKNNPVYCGNCGDPLTVNDNLRIPACSKPECQKWWLKERELRKRKCARKSNKKYRINQHRMEKIAIKAVGDDEEGWSHAKYKELQKELNKPNGRKCQDCGEALAGSYRQVCKTCKAKRDERFSNHAADGDWIYETAIDYMRYPRAEG